MSKLPFFAISLLVTGVCSSQVLSPTSVGSSGSVLVSNNHSLSYTSNNLSAPSSQISPDSVVRSLGPIDSRENADKAGSLALYPNPAVDNLWYSFKLNGQGTVLVSVYNCLGQRMQDVSYNNYDNAKVIEKFDVSMLPAGSYLLCVRFTNPKNQVLQVLNRKFQVVN